MGTRITMQYNKLIFGKDSTENIVNITIEDGFVHIYYNNGTHETVEYDPWVLSKDKFNQSERLKGNQYYKYINDVTYTRYQELAREWKRGIWMPRSMEEGFMLRHGFTYFKGMKVKDVSILSFDIEATSLNPEADNAEVILLSSTFRDGKGKITKKLLDIHDFSNSTMLIAEWDKFVKKMNPDIIIGHNILSYDLPYIVKSQKHNPSIGRNSSEIKFNEKVSKFRKDGSQQYEFHDVRIHGREVIDTMFLSIKYDIGRDFPSYGLKQIEKHLNLVDANRIEWDFNKYPTHSYKTWPKEVWQQFRDYVQDDSDSPIKIFDLMIPAFFYLTQSIPKTLQQIINEASGSQLDSLMIRSYLQDGWSQPLSSRTESFEGAISMGIPGVYKNVRKVDVASLYPSIMLEYNIYDKQKDPNCNMLKALDYFRTERLTNKRLAKETGDQYYDDLQSSQKIMINSLYGFMGANFLLYNYPKGASDVTMHGREILQKGVEWASGRRLNKVIKLIRNEGKANQEEKYEWIIGDVINQTHKGYNIVNVDTDSFSYTNGNRPSKEEFESEIEELNSIYPELIKWEKDGKTGIFDKVIVVKAKNYVLVEGDKVKFKGSSLTDQKKEPALISFLEEMIYGLLDEKKEEDLIAVYNKYAKKAYTFTDIKKWAVKKTVTSSVLTSDRLNEKKVMNAIKEAINKGIIAGIQEGDKIYVYQAIDGKVQQILKGEPVFLKKDNAPKLIDNLVLRFCDLWNGEDHDKMHYVGRVYDTLKTLQNVVPMEKFINYSLKKNEHKLVQNERV